MEGGIARRFTDTEELSAALKHAHVRAIGIERGSFLSELRHVQVDGWSLQYVNFIEGVASCSGDAPKDRHAFIVPLNWCPGCRLLGKEVSPNSIAAYAPGSEHADVSRPGLSIVVVTPPPLEPAGDTSEPGPFPRSGSHHLTIGEQPLRALRSVLSRIPERMGKAEDPGQLSRELREELQRGLDTAFANGKSERQAGRPPLPRQAILRRLTELMEEQRGEPIYADELAAALDISYPSLQRIFLDFFGLPPGQYLRLKRLYLARQRLMDGECDSVSEAASSCGFWEISRFTSLYKATFGELPSHTLRRARSEK